MGEKINPHDWDADWQFAQAGLTKEAGLHDLGQCAKDPLRCYACYVEDLEQLGKETKR